MNPFRAGLRGRLLFVALVAAAPAIAAIVISQSVARQRGRERTLSDNLRLVRLAAIQQAGVFDGARSLLLTLAEFPPMHAGDPATCVETLPNILRGHPGYLNLAVVNTDGTAFCSVSPSDVRLLQNARGRLWFERAMQSRTTAVGDYQFAGVSGKPTVVVAHPLLDTAGDVSRILIAAIDLQELGSMVGKVQLPPGATLTLFDREQNILARFPGGDSWVGHRVPDPRPVEHLSKGESEYTSESAGVDGIRRLFVTVPVRASIETGLYIGMGIDYDAAFSESDRVYRSYLWLLALVTLMGVGAAAIGGQWLVFKPMRALKLVTERLAAGDLSARAQLAGSVADLSELGDAVNAMAGALDAREHARESAAHALAERVALTSMSADVAVAINRPVELTLGLQGCADAITAHLDLAVLKIWVPGAATGALELAATAGDERVEALERWPLLDGERTVGVMALSALDRLSANAIASLTSVAALIALGVTRHRSEDALRRLAAIVASSDDAIYACTPDGTVVSWNAGAEALYGYTAEEVVGRSVTIVYPPDARAEHQELLDRMNRGERVTHRDTIRRRKNGSLVPVSLTSSPIKDAAGHVTGIAAVVRDMSRHRRREERLRLLALALESTNEMVSVTDTSDRFTFVNAAFLRAYGYTADEVIGQTPDLVHSRQTSPELLQDLLREARLGGWKGELLNRRKDGTEFFVSLNASAVRDDSGDVVGLLGVARDISERLGAEQALRGAEERMRFALEASRVGVWETNFKTGVTFWSETCEAMHGLAPGAFGRTYEAFIARIHPDDRADVLERIEVAMLAHRPCEIEYRTLWPDGTVRRISMLGHFSFDETGAAARGTGVTEDVTEQRSLEDQLRQSQKMDAIGQLAGGIAHDFNNLLTAILGFAGFLAESMPANDKRRADVAEIQRAAERAAAMTRQLLAFGRKQILEVRVLHVGDVLGEITPMLRRLLGETIELRTAIGDRGLVKTDPGQLQQVIVNLAVNARDAMPSGGRLTLETSDVVLDEAFARLHPSIRPGPHVMLAVSDTGHGMNAETLKRIFEPFFTTKEAGQGTGLGLATAYGIVQQSGGTVWVYSEVGRGTTFKVYLPTTDDEEVRLPTTAAAPAPGGSETVLLVEDEDMVREFVSKVLTRRGYSVHALGDPASAIVYARAHPDKIDLVFSDVVLPEMSGQAMVTEMQQGHPESKILYMSGYADTAIVHHGVLDAGTAFLQKPFTAEALARKVREVLDA